MAEFRPCRKNFGRNFGNIDVWVTVIEFLSPLGNCTTNYDRDYLGGAKLSPIITLEIAYKSEREKGISKN